MIKINNSVILKSIFILFVLLFIFFGKNVTKKTLNFTYYFLSGKVRPYDRYVHLDSKTDVLIPAKAMMLFHKDEKEITIFTRRNKYGLSESIMVYRDEKGNKFDNNEQDKIKKAMLWDFISKDTVHSLNNNEFIVDVFLSKHKDIPLLINAFDKGKGIFYQYDINAEYSYDSIYFYEYLNKIK